MGRDVVGDVLDEHLRRRSEEDYRWFLGEVIQASPLLIRPDSKSTGSIGPFRRLASYTPTVGHRVLVQQIGRNVWVCIGQVVA